jgi:hypothetical protein
MYRCSRFRFTQSKEMLSARAKFYRRSSFEELRLSGIAMAEHTLGHVIESQQALDEARQAHAAQADRHQDR